MSVKLLQRPNAIRGSGSVEAPSGAAALPLVAAFLEDNQNLLTWGGPRFELQLQQLNLQGALSFSYACHG